MCFSLYILILIITHISFYAFFLAFSDWLNIDSIFWVKNTFFYMYLDPGFIWPYVDQGSGMEKFGSEIQDPTWQP
jgi:hypothetical protein